MALSCTRCLSKGHGGCPATTEDENGIPICVWCLDGVPCPASSFRKVAAPAEPSREGAMKVCKGCAKEYKPSGNRQLYCEDCRGGDKKQEPTKPAAPERLPAKLPDSGAGSGIRTVAVQVTEKHLDEFWAGRSLEEKARLFSSYLG